VLAHVDDRIHAKAFAQPDIERQVVMRRHEIRVVVGFLRVDVVAARRLDADHHIAKTVQRQAKCAVAEKRISPPVPPSVQSRPH
jgi:hypothetical protein